MLTHKCGQCGQTFENEKAYLTHKCPQLGYSPSETGTVMQSEPPKITKKSDYLKLSEKEILKAVKKVRENKKN